MYAFQFPHETKACEHNNTRCQFRVFFVPASLFVYPSFSSLLSETVTYLTVLRAKGTLALIRKKKRDPVVNVRLEASVYIARPFRRNNVQGGPVYPT